MALGAPIVEQFVTRCAWCLCLSVGPAPPMKGTALPIFGGNRAQSQRTEFCHCLHAVGISSLNQRCSPTSPSGGYLMPYKKGWHSCLQHIFTKLRAGFEEKVYTSAGTLVQGLAKLEAHTPTTKRRGFNRCHLLVHTNNSSIIKKHNIF